MSLALLLLAGGYLVGTLVLNPITRILRDKGITRRNYRGRLVVTGAGLGLGPALLPAALLLASRDLYSMAAGLVVSGWGLGLAGLWDDVQGEEAHARGWRAHLGLLIRGRVTGGGRKILAGGGLSLLAASILRESPLDIAFGGALIALSANTFNQLDLRPGRSWKVFYLTILLLLPAMPPALASGWLALAGAGLALLGPELREEVMLGDSGANLLGAVWGYGLFLRLETWGLAAAALILLLIQLHLDRCSLSQIVEDTPWLRRLDQLGTGSSRF